MSVTTAQVQNLIILEVGDTSDGLLAANMATIWASVADKALVAPRLQELYAKRRAIDLLLGRTRGEVDRRIDGIEERWGQEPDRLIKLRADTQTEIVRIEALARAGRTVAHGTISTVAPEAPPSGAPAYAPPDANELRYYGDPYFTLPRTQG